MRVVRVAAAWLIAGVTLAASVTGLWHVTYDVAKMGVLGSVAIVAGFDVTALLVGLRIAEHPRAVKRWLGLIALAALSAAAQIAASDESLGLWRLLHGAPSVVALWTLHGAVGETQPAETKKPEEAKKPEGSKRSSGARSAPKSTPTAPSPAHVAAPHGRPTLAVVLDDDQIAEKVEAWLAEAGRTPSKASVQAAARALNLPCKGNQKALDVANLIRERRARAS